MGREVLHGDGWTWVRLSGAIDEGNRLSDALSDVQGPLVLLDVARIERINSFGVRDWMGGLQALSTAGRSTVLIDCSPAVVSQMGLVDGFTAGAEVYTIRAPYYCDACGRERTRVVQVARLQSAREARAPDVRCDGCGGGMIFDDIEATYFAFVERVRAAEASSGLRKALIEVARVVEDPPAAPESTTPPPDPPPAPVAPVQVAPRLPNATGPLTSGVRSGLSRGDMAFYVAVGVLLAVLSLVVVQLLVH